jgi:hypothetical protein
MYRRKEPSTQRYYTAIVDSMARRANGDKGFQKRPVAPRARPAPKPVGGGSRTVRGWPLWRVALGAAVTAAVLAFALTQGRSRANGVAAPPLRLGSLAALGHLASPGNPGPTGPEGEPVPVAPSLAAAGSLQPGQSVDGVSCKPIEQLAFHIHAHLTVFVDGAARQIPYGIGIAPPLQAENTPQGQFAAGGACFSWLHTHAADGIIHIESPVQHLYTLGAFFDVWGQQLGPGGVASAVGHVTAFVDGRPYKGDPRSIPLFSHAQLQLDVGRPLVAPESIRFANGL